MVLLWFKYKEHRIEISLTLGHKPGQKQTTAFLLIISAQMMATLSQLQNFCYWSKLILLDIFDLLNYGYIVPDMQSSVKY